VDGGEAPAEADEIVEVMDVMWVPVILTTRAEKSVPYSYLLILLADPTQFLIHITGGYERTIGVIYLVPI
jgi:hypothetical protein